MIVLLLSCPVLSCMVWYGTVWYGTEVLYCIAGGRARQSLLISRVLFKIIMVDEASTVEVIIDDDDDDVLYTVQ